MQVRSLLAKIRHSTPATATAKASSKVSEGNFDLAAQSVTSLQLDLTESVSVQAR